MDDIKEWTDGWECRKQVRESREQRIVKIHDRQPSIFSGRYVAR